MPSTFFGLEIASRALQTNQTMIEVTGHNISNVNTPGYSRQVGTLVTTAPYQVSSLGNPGNLMQMGTGVDVASVTRVTDGVTESLLRAANSTQSQFSQLGDILSRVEVAYNEPSSQGLNSQLTAFFNSFHDLASHPESASMRAPVRQQGQALARQFNDLAAFLGNLGNETTTQVTANVDQVNKLGQQIAQLNEEIHTALVAGAAPNDLLDQRDQLIQKVSTLAGAQVNNELDANGKANGYITLSIGGFSLVQGNKAHAITSQSSTINGAAYLSDGNAVYPVSGTLGGLIKGASMVAGYRKDLDTIAGAVIAQVNKQHAVGYGLDGQTGRGFFAGTDAATIRVDDAINQNLDAIAASAPPSTPGGTFAAGNGDNAIAIADIAQLQVFGTQTIADRYHTDVLQIGSDKQMVTNQADTQAQVTAQLASIRDSVSGVSLDEEMTHLLQYQRSYQAAARFLTTVDDLLNDLINNVGR